MAAYALLCVCVCLCGTQYASSSGLCVCYTRASVYGLQMGAHRTANMWMSVEHTRTIRSSDANALLFKEQCSGDEEDGDDLLSKRRTTNVQQLGFHWYTHACIEFLVW